MPQGWSTYRWTTGLLVLLLSCASVPPTPLAPAPLPSPGPLAPADRARVVPARTAGVQTLSAVLAVSYTLGTQRGTFDMIVNYAAPDVLRFTALKESLLSTQVLFDLLLTGETYHLRLRDATGEQIHTGSAPQLVREHPTFRTFFVVGEAFFLPGFASPGRPPSFNAAGTRLTTGLRSGARARWSVRPETLEVTRACLTWQVEETRVTVRLLYQDYRPVAVSYLPHRVTLSDRRLGFTAHSVVKSVDVNVPLAPGAFDVAS